MSAWVGSGGVFVRESVTFIHAADLHLGAPFRGLSTDNEMVGRELGQATYLAWSSIVDAAIERAVDFVVLAGDLYDAADPSLRSQMSLREQALRLEEAGIGLFIVRGNHDPLGGWSAGLTLPDNVHVFASEKVERIEAVDEDGFVCAVYGRSFQRADETSDFSVGYLRDTRDTVALGVLHANVGNNPDHDPYAPCTLSALTARRMDYFALGHIHKYEVLSADPYVVYAGSPQGLNPKETGFHGCCVVTVERGGVSSFEQLEIAPVVWATADVDLSGTGSLDRVEELIGAELDAARSAAGRPAVMRLSLHGRASVHRDLARPGVVGHLVDEIRAEQVAGVPWVWLDRLVDDSASELDIESLAVTPDFAGEVVRAASDLAEDEVSLAALLDEIRAPLLAKLPNHELGLAQGDVLAAARDRALDLLVSENGGAS